MRRFAAIGLVLIAPLSLVVLAADEKPASPAKIVVDDPANVKDRDFAVQGEYTGEIKTEDGPKKFGVQVVAKGGGKFQSVGYMGGLPGDGWNRTEKFPATGETKDGVTTLVAERGSGKIKAGVATIYDSNGNEIGQLKRAERKSSTMGVKPPADAVVLFDGTTADNFQGGRLTADKLLMQGVTSKQKFGSYTIHLEFRLPYQPQDSGQGRGNSGCYLQGRYEVQILDSFGLEGKNNECGGIYTIKDPDQNMCYPPLVWQTYDIDYTAAEYGADGKKSKNARMTVRHNGVVVQENVELPKATTGAPVPEGPEPGPVYLQDHGNPVRFRNIWVISK
ncbi:MAG: DUF1080 domain-containing protein [Planctomycetales bacterium]|nr:DUF1080 domain-containing protein [Planctomycetales bacterium]